MPPNPDTLQRFLSTQLHEFGGHVEIADGLWALFSVAIADPDSDALAREILAGAPFPYDSGSSADDWWQIYYVETAHREAAIAWLADLGKIAAGEIRPVAPHLAALIADLLASATPHRAARELGELHLRGEITAGLIRRPDDVRALLDRLHVREPLYFSAFQSLLAHHLIDMRVLHRQLIPEDVALKNEIVKAGLSRDPFLQSRQDATTEIRNLLMRFRVINPLDQQKNTAITNPYAAYLDISHEGDQIVAPIDGIAVHLPALHFLKAIRLLRRALYRGENLAHIDTAVPWMNDEIAYAFRFIKQRLDTRRDLTPLDALYMLEQCAEP